MLLFSVFHWIQRSITIVLLCILLKSHLLKVQFWTMWILLLVSLWFLDNKELIFSSLDLGFKIKKLLTCDYWIFAATFQRWMPSAPDIKMIFRNI